MVDGDTLTVAGVRIRIWGIDAPEGRQSCQDAGGRRYACGEVSTARMRKLVAERNVYAWAGAFLTEIHRISGLRGRADADSA